jgi:hypothetical protein
MDFSFLRYFSDNPLSLIIIGLFFILGIFIWKNPMVKTMKAHDKKHEKLDLALANIQAEIGGISKNVSTLIIENKNQEHKILYNTRDSLRLTIYSEAVNISDRLVAYYRYRDCGGNGYVSNFVEEKLIPGNEDIWKIVVKMEANQKERIQNIIDDYEGGKA